MFMRSFFLQTTNIPATKKQPRLTQAWQGVEEAMQQQPWPKVQAFRTQSQSSILESPARVNS